MVSGNRPTTTGHKTLDESFAQIEVGKSRDFVAGLLGEPDEKNIKDEGTEQGRWHYSANHHAESGFIVLFLSSTETRSEQTRNVEFKNGLVTRVWTE